MNGISALIKDLAELPSPFQQARTQGQVSSLQPERGFSPELDPADTLILDLQPLKL